MSTIYTTLPVTSAVAVSYIEASSEDMSVACADDTSVAMTVITDCPNKVEEGGANANPYGNADDRAGGGPRGSGDGSGDDGKDGGADGGKVGSGVDGEDEGADGRADGITSLAVSVISGASTPGILLSAYVVLVKKTQ